MQLSEGGSVQDHIKLMTEVCDELTAIGEVVSEEDRVVYLLASLPESFNVLVTALEATLTFLLSLLLRNGSYTKKSRLRVDQSRLVKQKKLSVYDQRESRYAISAAILDISRGIARSMQRS